MAIAYPHGKNSTFHKGGIATVLFLHELCARNYDAPCCKNGVLIKGINAKMYKGFAKRLWDKMGFCQMVDYPMNLYGKVGG